MSGPDPLLGADPARLRALLDSLGAGLYTVDEAGRLTHLNPEAERLLRRSAAEAIGSPAHALLHGRRPDGTPYPEQECPLLGVLVTGQRAECDDDAFECGDGELLPVSWVSAPVLENDRVTGAVVVFRSEQVHQALDAQRREALAAARAEQARVQAAHARLELLSATTQVLTATLDVQEALNRLSRLVVPRLADWCVLDVLDDEGQLARLALAHRDPSQVPEGSVPLVLPDPDRSRAPLAQVLRGTEPLTVTDFSSSPSAAGAPADDLLDVQLGLFRLLAARSALVVPLAVGRRVLGALTLVRTAGEPFVADDVDLAEELARRAALAVDNARLHTAQRDVAETLQRSLLTMLPHVDHITLAARYQPAGRHAQVGGDWYDSFLMPDGCTALVIGDVAGHDVEAAARMGQIRNMLRALAVDRQDLPGEVLRRLDLAIDAFRAADLATVVFGRVELLETTGERLFRWSNAGHPPPLLVHANGRTELLPGDPDLPLGVLPGQPRTESSRLLPPGSTLLLYTDGLVERRHDQVDTGLTRLRQVASRFARVPVDALCDGILTGLAAAHDNPDDIAILALRVPLPEHDGPPDMTPAEQGRALQAAGRPRLAPDAAPPPPEEP